MKKSEIIDAIASKADISKKKAAEVTEAFLETVTDALIKGDKVQIVGFGTFDVRKREARKGRDIRSGKIVDVPASKSPAFKAGKALKEAVNK
jgi:DNA-binding protein HU-beta